MQSRTDFGSYIIITAIAALIWYWAAGETRDEVALGPVTVHFDATDPATWLVEPASRQGVQLNVSGSQRAIENAEEVLRDAERKGLFRIPIVSADEEQDIDLAEVLGALPAIRETGILIESTNPPAVRLAVDELLAATVPVRAVLPGGGVEDVKIEPNEVTVTFRGADRDSFTGEPTFVATVGSEEIARLAPGVSHTLELVPVRPPEGILTTAVRQTEPEYVTVSFTLRSLVSEIELPTPVRIKVAGDPEDRERVTLHEKALRDVRVSAPHRLAEQLAAGDAVLIGLLHLKSSEMEARIDRKPLTCFIALLPDETAIPVDAWVGNDQRRHPVIEFTIAADDE